MDAFSCSRCGRPVTEHEAGLCAFCRMEARGDDRLLAHDARGWVARVIPAEARRYRRAYQPAVVVRKPCGCGTCDPGPESQLVGCNRERGAAG